VLRKHELHERQRAGLASDAFGGFSAIGWGSRPPAKRASHVFVSPGADPRAESAPARLLADGRAPLRRPAFRAGDLVHNSFSYHFTPAGTMMDSGAVAIGCTVFRRAPARPRCSCQAMADLRPDAYVGTPSFLRILLEKADETGTPCPR
jgi:phenylacetate-CoA ligase